MNAHKLSKFHQQATNLSSITDTKLLQKIQDQKELNKFEIKNIYARYDPQYSTPREHFTYTCKFCGINNITSGQINGHVNQHLNFIGRPFKPSYFKDIYQCQQHKMSFSQKSKLQQHKKLHHLEQVEQEKLENLDDSIEMLKGFPECSICLVKFESETDLESHEQEFHQHRTADRVNTPLATLSKNEIDEIRDHQIRNLNVEEIEFANEDNIDYLIDQHEFLSNYDGLNVRKKMTCNLCLFTLHSRYELDAHIKKHYNFVEYKCLPCGYGCYAKNKLLGHFTTPMHLNAVELYNKATLEGDANAAKMIEMIQKINTACYTDVISKVNLSDIEKFEKTGKMEWIYQCKRKNCGSLVTEKNLKSHILEHLYPEKSSEKLSTEVRTILRGKRSVKGQRNRKASGEEKCSGMKNLKIKEGTEVEEMSDEISDASNFSSDKSDFSPKMEVVQSAIPTRKTGRKRSTVNYNYDESSESGLDRKFSKESSQTGNSKCCQAENCCHLLTQLKNSLQE